MLTYGWWIAAQWARTTLGSYGRPHTRWHKTCVLVVWVQSLRHRVTWGQWRTRTVTSWWCGTRSPSPAVTSRTLFTRLTSGQLTVMTSRGAVVSGQWTAAWRWLISWTLQAMTASPCPLSSPACVRTPSLFSRWLAGPSFSLTFILC